MSIIKLIKIFFIKKVYCIIKCNNPDKAVSSTKTVYEMIHGGQIDGIKLYLFPRLVKLKPRKKKNGHSNPKKNKKVLGNSIEKRPEHINSRSEKGHYKIDAVKGKNGKEKKIPKIQEALNGRCTKILATVHQKNIILMTR